MATAAMANGFEAPLWLAMKVEPIAIPPAEAPIAAMMDGLAGALRRLSHANRRKVRGVSGSRPSIGAGASTGRCPDGRGRALVKTSARHKGCSSVTPRP